MADVVSVERRSEIMANIRSANTSIEIKVRKWLFAHKFRYRINDKRFPGKPDIVLPKYRTVVFINGCFWHGHGKCRYSHISKTKPEYWNSKIQKNIERDKKNALLLGELGWKVITIWECEVKTNFVESMVLLQKQIL